MASSGSSAGRAIILKGPLSTSKSFFTVLPGTLEELTAKASTLFPVPAGHNGQLVLDNGAILMPDVLPFLHEREVLTFRHAPDTPRSSLKRVAPFDMSKEASRGSASTTTQAGYDDCVGSSGGSSSGSRASRNVRWSDSVVPNEDKARKSAPIPLPQAKPIRYSATGRAEHARRVLGEQEQRRREEEQLMAAQKSTAAPAKPSSQEQRQPSPSITGSDKASKSSQSTKSAGDRDPFLLIETTDAQSTSTSKLSQPFKGMTMDDLLVSGSSPPSYTSATATAHSRLNSEEEQQGSSPVASPTRNIRGAQRQGAEWMKPLGAEKEVETVVASTSSPGKGRPALAAVEQAQLPKTFETAETSEEVEARDSAKSIVAETTSAPVMEAEENKETAEVEVERFQPEGLDSKVEAVTLTGSNDEEDERAVEQAIAPELSPRKVAKIAAAYQRMTSVVDTLQSHPANVFFRQPICFDETSNGFADFLYRNGRPPIDFATIRQGLHERRYGKTDPYAAVVADLDQMWSNAKAYFGASSNQGRCADFLDRFGKVILAEWRRETDSKSNEKANKTSTPVMAASRRSNKDSAAKFLRGVGNIQKRSAMPSMVSEAISKGSPHPMPMQNQQRSVPRPEQQSENAAMAKVATERKDEVKGNNDYPLSLRTQAATAKSPSKSDANSEAMIRLQQQFGPLPRLGHKNPQAQPGRGLKRFNQSVMAGDKKRAREVAVEQVEKEPVPAPLPVVTVTDETAMATDASTEPAAPAEEARPVITEKEMPAPPAEATVSVQTSESQPEVAESVAESTPRSSPRTKQRQQAQAASTKTRSSPRLRAGRKDSTTKGGHDVPATSPVRVGTRSSARIQKIAA